jgi:hypothetical protein
MNFPEPLDEFFLRGCGFVRVTTLETAMKSAELQALCGTCVQLGGRPYRVDGVETYCLGHLLPGNKVGLLGVYLIPGADGKTAYDRISDRTWQEEMDTHRQEFLRRVMCGEIRPWWTYWKKYHWEQGHLFVWSRWKASVWRGSFKDTWTYRIGGANCEAPDEMTARDFAEEFCRGNGVDSYPDQP